MSHAHGITSARPGILVAAVLAVLTSPASALAGAWEQPEGDAYAKIWARALLGNQGFGIDGETVPSADFTDVSLNHYVEYGLPQRFTLVTSGQPVGFARYADNAQTYVGRLGVGLRRSFLTGPLRLGVQADYGYQGLVGDVDLAQGTDPAGLVYRPVVAAHTGQLTGSFGYGTSWGWLALDIGVQAWSREIPVALVAMAQVGVRLGERVTLDLHLPLRQHFEPITVSNVAGTGATNYQGFGIGAAFAMTDAVGITATFQGAGAQANAATPSLMLGAEWRTR